MTIKQKDAVTRLCNQIQRRAIKSRDAHFIVQYIGGTGELHVWARAADHDYMAKAETWPKPLIDRYIDLSGDHAVKQLTDVLDEMKDLGGNTV